MNKRHLILSLPVAALVVTSLSAAPAISLIGFGLVPGSLLDKSGLTGQPICQRDDTTVCIDQATFGGFGSGIAATGHDDVFVAVPDRGPFDGRTDVPYKDRVHFLHIGLSPAAAFPNITTTLLDTRLLRERSGVSLVGDAYNFEHRFDPEGLAVTRRGTFFVSDEYGPDTLEFTLQGKITRRLAPAASFQIAARSGDVDSGGGSWELYPGFNLSGRQANRGMEGLAITPDGQWLVGIMQNALIQDHGLVDTVPAPVFPQLVPGRLGVNNRIVKINLATGERHEYVYAIEGISQGRGVNDLLAINDHEFLAIERDNRSLVPTPPNASQSPNFKRMHKIDLNTPNLTDVTDIVSLPAAKADLAAMHIVPVNKTLFIDLLDPSFAVNNAQLCPMTPTGPAPCTIKEVVAEKIEGLAWGPRLADGRLVLYVLSDNDLYPGLPTQIYAFAIDTAAAGVNYQALVTNEPMIPSALVKQRVP